VNANPDPPPDRSPVLGGFLERLQELEARRLGVLPLDAPELAAGAELAALIIGLLAREANVRERPLPDQALVGAHALRAWAQAITGEQHSGPAQQPEATSRGQQLVSKQPDNGLSESGAGAPQLSTNIAHPARVYDYWLGGKDNFPADRQAAEQAIKALPGIARYARANRAFLRRAVRYLAGEAGISQFLDLGTGIPTSPNVHEVAQQLDPTARIVYIDNEPIVLVHARALLQSTPEGATDYLDCDLRDPDKILHQAAETLDFSRPVAVLLLATLQLIPDADDPQGIVVRLIEAVPPGSFLAVSHPASDIHAKRAAEAAQQLNQLHLDVTLRARGEVARFFTALELVEPGLVQVHRWRPDPERAPAGEVPIHAGVARKP
jgi:S-adenosyl methyltransferase